MVGPRPRRRVAARQATGERVELAQLGGELELELLNEWGRGVEGGAMLVTPKDLGSLRLALATFHTCTWSCTTAASNRPLSLIATRDVEPPPVSIVCNNAPLRRSHVAIVPVEAAVTPKMPVREMPTWVILPRRKPASPRLPT